MEVSCDGGVRAGAGHMAGKGGAKGSHIKNLTYYED